VQYYLLDTNGECAPATESGDRPAYPRRLKEKFFSAKLGSTSGQKNPQVRDNELQNNEQSASDTNSSSTEASEDINLGNTAMEFQIPEPSFRNKSAPLNAYQRPPNEPFSVILRPIYGTINQNSSQLQDLDLG
jgi:hypothetical protein